MATRPFVEKGCVFRGFEAGGAIVTDDRIVAYPAKEGVLNTWHGARLGTWRTVAKWPVRSYMGSHMHQIEATLTDGRVYTGRGFGEGTIFTGRLKRGKR